MKIVIAIMFTLISAAFVIRNSALAELILRRNGVQASSGGYHRRKLLMRLWFISLGAICFVLGLFQIWRIVLKAYI